jgi:hypothetical protein
MKAKLLTVTGVISIFAIYGSSALRAQTQTEDQFASHGNTSAPTGTQGVEGNSNCAPPVINGVTPINWSCPTGPQTVQTSTKAAQTGTKTIQTGTTTNGSPGFSNQRPTTVTQSASKQTRPSAARIQSGQYTGLSRQHTAKLEGQFNRVNNIAGVQMGNAYAKAMGLRPFQAAPQQLNVGAKFGFGQPSTLHGNMQSHVGSGGFATTRRRY